ncbi:pilus assembly protein TadG-related protein [Aurantiacibacter flavus]|uniref:Pilus assembly protein TadG-related protein n=1 Tax=Aurantiacibacter flavus TaxID=3145232 RepID=A0ABV0CW95_9SPHN
MIIAAALLPLVGMVGGGLDIGRGYLVQARLQQACDAGVLAARKRLGTETVVSGELPSQTAEIGDRFFRTNFKVGAYGSTERRFQMALEEDYSVTGVASVKTPTTLMGIFGEDTIDVRVECSAQLNFANTDVMMVLDVTGSMATNNPGDTASRLEVLKGTIRTFHQQLQATAEAGSRIRYGFLPYSTNVNVGGILKDEWVVDKWGYQSRQLRQTGGVTTTSFATASSPISGSLTKSSQETYPASTDYWGNKRCTNRPYDTVSSSTTKTGETNEPVVGPPPGTRNTKTYERTRNGDSFEVTLDGSTCTVIRTSYSSYKDTYAIITEPSWDRNGKWVYDRIANDVTNWRDETYGCIEERQTYEIDDYSNVDLRKALDLNIDLVPTDNPAALGISVVEDLTARVFDLPVGDGTRVQFDNGAVTKWRPMYPDWIYGREKEYNGAGSFSQRRRQTATEFISPRLMGTDACPAPAAKLSTMTERELDSYLATLHANGSTYHDIGMIWGGRMISPTGLFAAENGDVAAGSPTSRNLIFLTDGETSALDISYGTYGFEPVDQRRWSPTSRYTLVETIEKRFEFACSEVKKRGITVWVIGFGVDLNQIMRDCAGDGHFFEAADAAELNLAFGAIARNVSELRIVE